MPTGERRQAPLYHVVDDFLTARPRSTAEREAAAGDLTVAPYWILAVARLGPGASASRRLLTNRSESCSYTSSPSQGVLARGPVLLLEEVVDLSVRHSKRSYLGQLQATILDSGADLVASVLPGDWLLAWMLQSEEQGLALRQRIQRNEACNDFMDGLKFVGRVHDIRRNRQRDPEGGVVRSTYSLTGVSFGEFQAKCFFDPHLAESSKGIGTWLAKIGVQLMDLLRQPRQGGGSTAAIDTNAAIPRLFELFLGSGVSRRAANPSSTQAELRIGTGLSPPNGADEAPYAYLVPEEVGQLLGKRGRSKRSGILSYADLCELLVGVQRFTQAASGQQGSVAPWTTFLSDGIEPAPAGADVPQHKHTGRDVLGQFIPVQPDFSNKPVWTILEQYLNPTINEMYAALRVNEAGRVVPTVVVRQMPLSSEEVARKLANPEPVPGEVNQAYSAIQCTRQLELPRWVVHPALVYEDSLGRTDANRFNFIHIGGQAAMSQHNASYTYQLVRNPPLRDDLDIQRSGLRPYMAVVACSLEDAKEGPRRWMELASDWLMGQHLTLNGHLHILGIQAPIVHGDNCEFDGAVYHIEDVLHRCALDIDGKRSFSTTLQLSHGVRSDADPAYRQRDQTDSYLYAHMLQSDKERLPGYAVDGVATSDAEPVPEGAR